MRIDNCIDSAYDVYSDNWDGECGIEGKADGCNLSTWRADDLDDEYKDNKDRCVERYN